ncbi:recombinase RmuC [Oceanicoccus sagamiensis]|uniref:Recombinase RmuC n=1 Tax=Oceanicoccus sagamiensis TaxID=716816 RepID=A0A1X9NMC8_9GAMM|nr:recombinase RmuC [Oceanicoccus sagamiensis]
MVFIAIAGIGLGALVMALLGKSRQAELLQQHQQEQQQGQQQAAELKTQLLVLESQAEAKAEQLGKAEAELSSRDHALAASQQQLSEQGAQMAALRTELQQQRESAEDKIKTLEETRQQLSREFELLANRIFDEKTERFNKNSKSTLDTALTPLREQLKDFKQKVEDVYDKDSKERVSLSAELGQLKQLNQQMSADALNLTNALKGDNKAQGNWGEVILERVLEESGLHKGREYETQVSLKAGEGRTQQPDVIVRLPENKDLIIDSKVSLVHYERYCNGEDHSDREQALKDHIASVRAHIKGLSIKNYEGLEGLRTLDFVLIFIPIESAFMAAFEHDQAMFKEAYEKNIIVVGPTTLLATLRTIQSIWRYERQNKNAEEIARQAGAMHDKFAGFITDLDKIQDHLERAGQAHQSAMNKLKTGKGNLVGSTQRLEKLGAKVKKSLPDSVNLLELEADTEIESDPE